MIKTLGFSTACAAVVVKQIISANKYRRGVIFSYPMIEKSKNFPLGLILVAVINGHGSHGGGREVTVQPPCGIDG